MPSLYLHVPFREAPRPYDEAAYEVLTDSKQKRYLTALVRELDRHVGPRFADAPAATLYVGGGRPSLLPPGALRRIGDALSGSVRRADDGETTVELNPADLTPPLLDALRHLGATRVSVEVLSFEPSVLRAAEAPHTAGDALAAVRQIRDAGFDSFSVDLLFGLPGLSLTTWTRTLRRAVDLGVPHVSLQEAPPGPDMDDDARAEQLERAMTLLSEAGYEQYGLPHFARRGHASLHQQRYYEHHRYVGAGPSAASFWGPSSRPADRAERWTNLPSLNAYATALADDRAPVAERTTLDVRDLAREYVMLRLQAGVLDLQVLRERYDTDLHDEMPAVLDRLAEAGLLRREQGALRLTPRGRCLTDAITRRLMPQ